MAVLDGSIALIFSIAGIGLALWDLFRANPSARDYNARMSREKAKHNIALASILKLNNLNEQSPIVWMDL